LGGLAPSRCRLDVRVVVLGVAVHHAVATPQEGHRRAVVHGLRNLDGDAEQLELALVAVGIAEPVGRDYLVAGTDALEPVKVPIVAEHALGLLEDALGVLRELGVDDDDVIHGIYLLVFGRYCG